ncbi:hypothetical protein BVRB_6g140380 [Beta vulgaris subsp. vulgaris]|nr:hypothetical protein BVRB_6g140380 [Beta vulgaris subsp. vulgaris]
MDRWLSRRQRVPLAERLAGRGARCTRGSLAEGPRAGRGPARCWSRACSRWPRHVLGRGLVLAALAKAYKPRGAEGFLTAGRGLSRALPEGIPRAGRGLSRALAEGVPRAGRGLSRARAEALPRATCANWPRHSKSLRLSIDEKGRRLRNVCKEMAGPKDEEYLESIGEVEVDELHHAWLDMSIRMTMVARRRITLTAENERLFARVAKLEAAARGHQANVKDLETKLHKSECELTRAMRAIDNDQVDFQEKSKELNGQIGQLTRDRDSALKKVSRLSARLEEARREAERSSAEWFHAWGVRRVSGVQHRG